MGLNTPQGIGRFLIVRGETVSDVKLYLGLNTPQGIGRFLMNLRLVNSPSGVNVTSLNTPQGIGRFLIVIAVCAHAEGVRLGLNTPQGIGRFLMRMSEVFAGDQDARS